ncbi:hypothetical protein BD309DRAFT_956349 [Dichomitus squalens]|nr:hypothetical protein BD309DRAFT_956349 [Dichomitus squalens]
MSGRRRDGSALWIVIPGDSTAWSRNLRCRPAMLAGSQDVQASSGDVEGATESWKEALSSGKRPQQNIRMDSQSDGLCLGLYSTAWLRPDTYLVDRHAACKTS